MTIHMQTLYDVLVAIVTTVGIAVAVSIALVVAGAVHERGQKRRALTSRPDTASGQHPTQTGQARELLPR